MSLSFKKYKIALIGYQLSNGGLEKVMSSLSIYFGSQNIEVHNILFVDEIGYPYSGILLNIGEMKLKNKGFLEKLKLFLFFKNYIKQNKFDCIIDFRYRKKPLQELIFSKFVYDRNTIYTVHSSKLDTYLPNSVFLTKMICKNKNVVCVSKEIKQLVENKYHIENLKTIYNPIDFDKVQLNSNQTINFDFPYVICIGKFDAKNVKQVDKLIVAYSKSILPKKGIKLVLLGVGKSNRTIIRIAENVGIEKEVLFLDFNVNPYKYLKNAKFLVLCSKYEGFPMSIIESLACNTPVVSFDCISGPKEIITNMENGLLVENQNFEKLTVAMNLFVEDEKLYEHCKKNTLQSVSKFSIEKIGKQWLELMKIDIIS